MTVDLAGRVALVTGAARRTGRGLALALARAGADVVVHYGRSQHEAEQVVAEIAAGGRRAWAIAADLARPGAAEALIEAALAAAGRLDILVNNVGNYPLGDPLELEPAAFRATLETNLTAPYALIRSARTALAASGQGHVINLGYAGVEHLVANTRAMAYQVSKPGCWCSHAPWRRHWVRSAFASTWSRPDIWTTRWTSRTTSAPTCRWRARRKWRTLPARCCFCCRRPAATSPVPTSTWPAATG